MLTRAVRYVLRFTRHAADMFAFVHCLSHMVHAADDVLVDATRSDGATLNIYMSMLSPYLLLLLIAPAAQTSASRALRVR